MIPYLTILVLLPVIGALALSLLPASAERLARPVAFGISGAALALAAFLTATFNASTFHFQFTEYAVWIQELGIHYRMGVDGISIWMVLLSTILTIVAILATPTGVAKPKAALALILLIEASLLGAFASLDLVQFFIFFELMLLPTYFLINLWGGEGRAKAASKFLIYTFAGSIFMLVGIIALGVQFRAGTGVLNFGIANLQDLAASGQLWARNPGAEVWVFWAFAVALLVKTPSFPFHSWIGDTYGEAPVSVPILSSAMVKLGVFGMFRFLLPIFPNAVQSQAPVLMALAVASILYGAIVAAIQPDIRRMMGYSSLSHMGFAVLGVFSLSHAGMVGGSFQMFAHGISTAALLYLTGILLQRYGTTRFEAFGGLKAQMPVFAALFLLAMLGSVALPTTSGFIGEFLALLGAFTSGYAGFNGLGTGFAVAAGLGAVLGAVYLLYLFQQVFYGPTKRSDVSDIGTAQAMPAAVLAAVIFLGGLMPNLFIANQEPSLQAARFMATSPAGERPSWLNPTHQIVAEGARRGAFIKTAEGTTWDAARRGATEGELVREATPYPLAVAKAEGGEK